MSDTPDQYGVVGHPVAHSWSPFIHGLFAQATGQSLVYRLYDIPPENFRARVLQFFSQGGRGLNVTVPHKAAATELANELTPRAERARAVNTLGLQAENRILGDNTDGVGLVRDLRDNLGVAIADSRILIVGAGGAARGVLAPLLSLEPAEIVVANRTPERAHELAADFADLGAVSGCGFNAVPAGDFDLIINATSASLRAETPELASATISARTVCYDMAYGRGVTPFARWALGAGCARALQGWGMLVEQAAESFSMWRGIKPDTRPVLAALREHAKEA